MNIEDIKINNLLLRIKKVGKDKYINDMKFITDFDNEIDNIIKIDEEERKIIYTRSGSYRLNDGSNYKGYMGLKRADIYYINNVFDKNKMNTLEEIINYYFLNLNHLYPPKSSPDTFTINKTNSILSRDDRRWRYDTEYDIRSNQNFKNLVNTMQ